MLFMTRLFIIDRGCRTIWERVSLAISLQGDPGTVFDKSSLLTERIAEANR